jgi:hypothetical protein
MAGGAAGGGAHGLQIASTGFRGIAKCHTLGWRGTEILRFHGLLRDGIRTAMDDQEPKPTHLMNTIHDHCIKICNSLLRNELSAGETYGQALEKYQGTPVADELRRIRSQHAHSAAQLAANIRQMGGEPDRDSGTWGIVAATVEGAAILFGSDSAISLLAKGEELGRKNYQEALLDDEVMPECKVLIRDELLPLVVNHIASLEKLEQTA